MRSIETERLELIPWEPTEDMAIELYEYARHPEVGPAAGWAPHESPRHSLDIIKELFIPQGDYAIKIKDSGHIIGSIGLMPDKRREAVKSKELGYSLGRMYWGKGIMTEAARALIDFGFSKEGLDIISIAIYPCNERSLSVARKCGFVKEGTIRKACKGYDGSFRDAMLFSIIREEWEKNRRELLEKY